MPRQGRSRRRRGPTASLYGAWRSAKLGHWDRRLNATQSGNFKPLVFCEIHAAGNSVSPAKFGGYKGYALAAHEELVRKLVAEQPDITLAEIKAVLAKEKVAVGQSSISRFLHHLNLRFKKIASS